MPISFDRRTGETHALAEDAGVLTVPAEKHVGAMQGTRRKHAAVRQVIRHWSMTYPCSMRTLGAEEPESDMIDY